MGDKESQQTPFEIEIFQVGQHTSEEGSTLDFPPELIDQAIAGYDPGSFRVPLIVSHNTGSYSDRAIVDSELAFGVVDKFKRIGNKVFASFKKYVPQVKEWFNQGRLHSFSSSFYLPNSPINPHPGKLSFRHIAALGVNPPAVKGMAAPEFSEFFKFQDEFQSAIANLNFTETEADGVVAFGCCGGCGVGIGGENPLRAIATAIRGVRDWIIDSKDTDTADKVLPPELVSQLEKLGSDDYSLMSRDAISNLWSAIDELTLKVYQQHEQMEGESPHHEYSNHSQGTSKMGSYKKAMKNFMSQKSMSPKSFMDKMGVDDEDMATSYMDGSKKMPMEMQKKMADFMGMDVKKFQDAYMPDETEETASMSENEAQLRRELEAAQAEVVRLRAEKRREEVTHFCEKYKGKFPTAIYSEPTEISFGEETAKVGIVDFMASLSDKQLAYAKEMIKSLPNTVNFKVGEEIVESGETPQFSGTVDFNEIARLARIKAKELNVSHAEAVDLVVKETGLRF